MLAAFGGAAPLLMDTLLAELWATVSQQSPDYEAFRHRLHNVKRSIYRSIRVIVTRCVILEQMDKPTAPDEGYAFSMQETLDILDDREGVADLR